MYAQISEGHGDAATGKTKVVVVVGAAQIEETDSPPPPPTAGTIPAAVVPGPVPDPNSNPPERKAQRAAPRKRIPPPAPVPHLIKKSRGRRVPEPDEAKERAHICAVPGCSKSFARAEHLKRHVISLHTHEKRTCFFLPLSLHPLFFWMTCTDMRWHFFFIVFLYWGSLRM
jgi:hypothetical protein